MSLRRVAKWLLGDYTINRIYCIACGEAADQKAGAFRIAPLEDPHDFTTATDPAVRRLATYLGSESYGFGAWVGGELVSACFLWTGSRYALERKNYWSLQRNEAKLVQIVTAAPFRGRGIATELCRRVVGEMGKKGLTRLFARVWHSNRASIRTFEKAGWRRIALVVEVTPLRLGRPWRFVKRTRSKMPP